MKQILTTLLIFICLFTNAQNDFENYKSLVKQKMENWLKKGKFEKQIDYQNRLKLTLYKLDTVKKIALFAMLGFRFNPQKNVLYGEQSLLQVESYDADNELITFTNKLTFKCNNQNAKQLKEGKKGAYIFPIEYGFYQKKMYFIKTIISYNYNNNTHKYNYNNNSYEYYNYNLTCLGNELGNDCYKKKNSFDDIFADAKYANDKRNCFIFTNPNISDKTPDPELTLADLNIPLSDKVKALVYSQ